MAQARSTSGMYALAIMLLLAATVLRLAVSPSPGERFDLSINQGWAKSAVILGLSHSYTEQLDGNMLPNHAPLSIMFFASMGHLYKAMSPAFDTSTTAFRVLIKVPAMVADILTAIALGMFVWLWRGRTAGLIAMTVYAFHPAVLYESTVWGQTDALPALFVILGIGAVAWNRPWAAGICMALAVLAKAQAVALMPVLFVPLFFRPTEGLKAVVAGLFTWFIVFIPFIAGGTAVKIMNMYAHSVGYYPIVSSAAYNFWWTLFGDAAGSKPSTDLLFNIMPYRTAGILMFAGWLTWALWATADLWKSKIPKERWEGMMLAGSITAYAFFLFNTEMHERYLFPMIPLALPFIFYGRRMAITYCLASLFFLLNLMGYLQFGTIDRAFHQEFPLFDVFIACGQVVCFGLMVAWVGGRRSRTHTLPGRIKRWLKRRAGA